MECFWGGSPERKYEGSMKKGFFYVGALFRRGLLR